MKKNNFLLLHMNSTYRKEDIETIEKELSKKIGMNVVILDGKFSDSIQLF